MRLDEAWAEKELGEFSMSVNTKKVRLTAVHQTSWVHHTTARKCTLHVAGQQNPLREAAHAKSCSAACTLVCSCSCRGILWLTQLGDMCISPSALSCSLASWLCSSTLPRIPEQGKGPHHLVVIRAGAGPCSQGTR